MKPVSPCKLLLLSAILFFFFTTPCRAFNATLKWDLNTEPDFDHYVVYWGTSSGNYTSNSGDIGTDTTYVAPNLDDNTNYYFVVRAVGYFDGEEVESLNSREVCVFGPNHPDLDPGYDRGWAITAGNLKGFSVMYDSNDPTPTLGKPTRIPPLNLPGIKGVGAPLNLTTQPPQPPWWTFNVPVRVSIPCPGYLDVSALDIYYYEDAKGWTLANDANYPDTVQPGAESWMVEGSRDNSKPYAIRLDLYHFSGTQAGTTSSAGSSSSGGGGCFIATGSGDL